MVLRFWLYCALAIGWAGMTACSSKPPESTRGVNEKTPANRESKSDKQEQAERPTLEPFDPPPLSEIDAKADWQAQPVRDSLEHLNKYLAEHPPLVTDREALQLRNDSPEANEKILSALGRQPKDEKEVDGNASLTLRLGGEVRSMNPVLSSSTTESEVGGLISSYLLAYDWNFLPYAEADFVVRWDTSKDGLIDKITMRDDILWSDGTRLTAHDVAFTFQLIMDPDVPVPAIRSGTDRLRWVHAYDDRTVVYFHKEALATNAWNLFFPILPRHIFASSYPSDKTLSQSARHVEMENKPVTSGPYEVASRQRGREIVLRRRENFYMVGGKQVRAKPYFQTVRFQVIEDSNTALLGLKKGDLDSSDLTPEQWVSQTTGADFYDKNTKVTGVEWTSFHFAWNMKTPLFRDVRVRQAMSYAYDYEDLLKRLSHGLYQPSAGVFYKDSWMAPKDFPEPYTQDLDKAEELLDEAGWTDSDGDGIRDKDGKPFRFSLLYRGNEPTIERICNVLRESLEQIGVECNLRPMEFTQLVATLQDRNFEAAFGGWGTGTDPFTLENIWGTGEERNYSGYSNPEVDTLFEEGLIEMDRDKRAEIYGKIHNLIYKDQPYTFLYWRASFYGFNKGLRGYHMSPRGPFSYSPGTSAIWKIAP